MSEIQTRVERFMKDRVLPQCHAVDRAAREAENERPPAIIDTLREQARAEGLWNLGLPGLPEDAPGTRLSNR